jgi:hypothetical protein
MHEARRQRIPGRILQSSVGHDDNRRSSRGEKSGERVMDFADIKQVRRTTSDEEVNKLLQEGWVLIDIEKNCGKWCFLLVRK